MSKRDVSLDEMRRISGLSDRDIERLFAGQAPDGDTDLSDVARFFEDLNEAYPEASTQVHEAAHVAAMLETAQLLAENGEPVARPASKAYGPENQASGLPKWRRKIMLQQMFASTKARVAAVALVLVMATSGTAFAAASGALPAPVQDAVAGVASVVGVDLPDSQEADVENINEGDVQNVEGADLQNTNDGEVKNVDEGDVNNKNDGDVQNTNDGDANNTDNGAANNTNDGDINNTDEGGAANTNDGGAGNTDNGAGNPDQGGAGNSGNSGAGQSNEGDGQN